MQFETNTDTSARVEALARLNVLDSASEQGFDDIVKIAAELCATPVALVTLLGRDRQWFKAKLGTDISGTPISLALCTHALGRSDTLVIPDLTKDERTRANGLVTGEPHVRFYAGAPLVTSVGVALGTLCVLDTVPRPEGLTLAQSGALEALARQVVRLMEMRRTLADENTVLREADDRSRGAQEAGGIGTFEVDIATNTLTVSAEMCRMFGLPVAPSYPGAVLEACFDRTLAVSGSTEQARADGRADLDVEYRIRRADDGRLRWIARRAEYVRDPEGNPVRMLGTVQDVTERRRAQELQTALLELGDRLRPAQTTAEAVAIAAEILGRTLGVSRAGYSTINLRDDLFEVERDWTAPGAASLAGRYSLNAFRATIDHVREGQTIALPNVEGATWLSPDLPGYRRINTRAQVKVPLIIQGELVGLLYAHQSDPRVWSQKEVEFAQGVADRTYAALAKLRAEAEQQVLNLELSHRMKNTLSLVQAVAAQTLKGAAEPEALAAFDKRLSALARAHEVLLQENWTAAHIGTVVERVLAAQSDMVRIHLRGPDIIIGAKATLSLSLLLHELATNAAKYGALSNGSGVVDLRWRLDEAGEELEMTWRERGGPPVQEPTRRGFGTRLLRMGLVGTGNVHKTYEFEGFEARFAALVSQLQH